MKIKLSKSQWEMIGRKARWMKTAQSTITQKYFVLGNRQTGQVVQEGVFDYSGNPDDIDLNVAKIVQNNGLGKKDNLGNMNLYWTGNSYAGTDFVLAIDSDKFKAQQIYQASTSSAKAKNQQNLQNQQYENKLDERQQKETKYVKQHGMPQNNDLSSI